MASFTVDPFSSVYKRVAGELGLLTIDLAENSYEQDRVSRELTEASTAYFATFASNFSRIFSIFGFAWKVQ